jgi:hypothetical protein
VNGSAAHHLVNVTGSDVVLGFAHVSFEALLRVVRPHRECGTAGGMRVRQAALELALQELDLGACELIERLQIVVRRDARVRDDQDPVLHMVERQHGVKQHEPGFVGAVCG